MPQPEKFGKVGTVLITYRPGHSGVTIVAGMPEWDFERLQNLVGAYEEHDKLVDQLNDHPNEQVRKTTRSLLGLPQRAPRPHMEPRSFDFPLYDVRGRRRNKQAVNKRIIKLEPKYIQKVEFTRAVEVTN
jgi:hypothetical protein